MKQFFRAAVEADKPIIVIFNQCELDADAPYWPQWLETFCQQTGATPESAYVIPYDRRAAEELRLKFYWIEGLGAGGQEPGARDEGPGAREEGPGARDQGLKSKSPNLRISKSPNH